ncbi:MAG: alpha-glucosidase [Maledivibacter sp.]|nr:alpha-glucosidase [Maledivibacter sp.]
MSDRWWENSVIYEIFPRSFKDSNGDGIGDIQGIISKLDYIRDLGVDAIWLCPIYKSPNDDSGYDISDYYSIWNELGTMEDFHRLVAELKKRDIKLIMDLVVNHSSDEHEWFIESKKSKDNPYRDYYIWKRGKNGKKPNNWLATKVGGSAWEYDEGTDEYYLHIYSKKQPDFNWENPRVRQSIYDIMKFWIDKGVDGFRMDVINKIAKEDGLPDVKRKVGDTREYLPAEEYFQNHPKVHKYLKEMNKEVLSKYEGIMALGQTQGLTPEDAYLYTGEERNEINMFLQFEHVELDKKGNRKLAFDLVEFKRIINKWQIALDGKLWNTIFFGSHDLSRSVSHFGNDKKYRIQSAKMLATILLTLKGTPIVYFGDEIGMTNVRFSDIDDYRDIRTSNIYKERVLEGKEDIKRVMEDIWEISRDNARTPMQWDLSKNSGFTNGEPWIKVNENYKEINVYNNLIDENSIYNYYKKMIKLRKNNDVLRKGKFKLLLEKDEYVFSYIREWNNKKVLIIASFSNEEIKVNLDLEALNDFNNCQLLISNYENKYEDISDINLRPYEVRVYSLNN